MHNTHDSISHIALISVPFITVKNRTKQRRPEANELYRKTILHYHMMIKFDGEMSEMSCVIYHNVAKDEIQGLDSERVELMVEIYKSADDFRTQTDSKSNRQQELQCTGKNEIK